MRRSAQRILLVAAIATVVSASWAMAAPARADAATVAYAWRASLGMAASDAAVLSVYADGSATLRFDADETPLASRVRYAASIHSGGCHRTVSRLGPLLLTVKGTIATGSRGSVSRSVAVSAAEARKVRAAWNRNAGVALIMGARSGYWCFPLGAIGRVGEPVRVTDQVVVTVVRAESWAGDSRWVLPSGTSLVTVYVRVRGLKSIALSTEAYRLATDDAFFAGALTGGSLRRQPALTGRVLHADQTVEGWVTQIVDDEEVNALLLAFRVSGWSGRVEGDGTQLLVPLGPLATQGPDRPTPGPTPTPTATPSPTPTPTPSPSPTPTPSAAATPTPSVSPAG